MAKRKKNSLTDFSWEPKKRGRGRPTLLEDLTLLNRRDGFLQIVEWHWGELGWALPRCKEPEDVGRAVEFLSGRLFHEIITLLCRPSNESGSRVELCQVRKQIASLVPRLRKENDANREAQERLQRAQAALPQAPPEKQPLFKGELRSRKSEARRTEDSYRSLASISQEQFDRLRGIETSYARREVFEFIRSNRYEVNPVNLANATAGLPFMGWRQSMKRCRKNKSPVANGLCYQAFKAIRYLISTASANDEDSLVQHFKSQIPLLSKRHTRAKEELAQKWFFLERAVRESCRGDADPNLLPFAVTKEFFGSFQTQTALDVVLAEESRLSLVQGKWE